MKRSVVVALVSITIVGVIIRLPCLLHDGLYRDDANVYVELSAGSLGDFFHRVAALEWHPPLYFFFAYLWSKIAGTSELALKGLPFVFSLITIPAVYRLGKLAASEGVGLVAAAFFAVTPLAVDYSTMYVYPFAGFVFVVLAIQVAHARREHATPMRLVLVTIATALATYTHYSALFFVPALVIWALTSPTGLRQGAVTGAAIAIGCLPFLLWFPVFMHQQHIGLPYQTPTSIGERAAFFLMKALLAFVPVRAKSLDWTVFATMAIAGFCLARRQFARSDAAAMGVIFLLVLFLVSCTGLMRVRLRFAGLRIAMRLLSVSHCSVFRARGTGCSTRLATLGYRSKRPRDALSCWTRRR